MIAAIKSELRKLLTTRSTYFTVAFAVLLVAFLSFFVDGYKGGVIHEGIADLRSTVQSITGVCALLSSIVVVLFVAHEYRYNTIMYSLTAIKSRMQFIIAKAIVTTLFTVAFAAIVIIVGMIAVRIGLAIHGGVVSFEPVPVVSVLGKVVFYFVSFAWIAFLLTFLIRNVVGPVVIILLVPGTLEALLGLALKDNARYLPFRSLENVLASITNTSFSSIPQAAFHTSVLLVVVYITILATMTLVWFQRRDAN